VTEPNEDQQVEFVQPRPSQETWLTKVLEPNVGLVTILSVNGQHLSFMSADAAITIGQQILDMGRQAKSGLIVPPAGAQLPPPPPPPNGHGRRP
jgi:hypothetical protein